MFTKYTIMLPLALLAACSASPIVPSVATFSEAAQTAVGSHLTLVETKSHEKEVAEARLRILVNEKAAYEQIGADGCLYVNPTVKKGLPSFDEICNPKLFDPNRKTIATYFDPPAVQRKADRVLDALPDDEAIMQQHEAIQLAKALQSYAETLAKLASSTAPQDVGTSASSTITAIGALYATVNSVNNRQGKQAAPAPDFARYAGIVSVVSKEILEARRYRMLKQTVTQADPFVRIASQQLATMALAREKGSLEPAVTALRSAANSFDADKASGIMRIETALANLRTADSKAAFRHFVKLRHAHAAILASFDAPLSAEDLAAANTRINDFLDAVKSK